MNNFTPSWDYLIVTASNDFQARAYEAQLELRRRLGFLAWAKDVLVVADPGGRRVGSGGSTLYCLIEVVNREVDKCRAQKVECPPALEILRNLRILIIHAGGDSRRLPAYGPCGKIFIPVPGTSDSVFSATLFDRLILNYKVLPAGARKAGQVVVTSGDALLLFDPSSVNFDQPGMTAVTCPATPETAARHGVFCQGNDGRVSLYFQKPSVEQQQKWGVVNRSGQSLLDIGIMSFDASMALALFEAFGIRVTKEGRMEWGGAIQKMVFALGVDFYREICCAIGDQVTEEHYFKQAWNAGSKWKEPDLRRIFRHLCRLPFCLSTVPQARFLHFGTTRQLISSGVELRQYDLGAVLPNAPILLNNQIVQGEIIGGNAWVEGCRIAAPLRLTGGNVVIGIEVNEPLSLPENACLDVLRGRNRNGKKVWFVRFHGLLDTFKDAAAKGGTFCGKPMLDWISTIGAKQADVWDHSVPEGQRSLWNARVFPAEGRHGAYRDWLWMLKPEQASPEQRESFLEADRYSAAEIAVLADQKNFFTRRQEGRAEVMGPVLQSLFRNESGFSARELIWLLRRTLNRGGCLAGLFHNLRNCSGASGFASVESFQFSRVLHTLGTVVVDLAGKSRAALPKVLTGLNDFILEDLNVWMAAHETRISPTLPAADWAAKAQEAAFAHIHRTILNSSLHRMEMPHNALRKDETVWGRAPARLELGGGWTDTPPYTLEFGGEVLNSAINLNGQPPIHCYGRVVEEPVIRIFSIDTGLHVEIRELDELMSFRDPRDVFGLVKAAFAISGFSPDITPEQRGKSLRQILRDFGGGIELTTLVGIPKGSGLGTSSILGAAIVAVLARMIGRSLTQRELFHQVLRLEQALTTGGGWQDQVGGAVGGTKITFTQPGLFPDPRIHFVPSDILNPSTNGGSTLLYYTGITRLAKNILQKVVGGYLNRDRVIMDALNGIHQVARATVDSMARKDMEEFGYLTNVSHRLTKQLCADVSNEPVEELLERIRPHVFGARLMGAGSGGFMMMICKSPGDAAKIRDDLLKKPLNECSRFFDFDINNEGLQVTSC